MVGETNPDLRAVLGAAWMFSAARRCRMGRVKAAVLPVPVWAAPMRSLRAMMTGIA